MFKQDIFIFETELIKDTLKTLNLNSETIRKIFFDIDFLTKKIT